MSSRPILGLAMALVIASPVAAQSGDDSMDDHERQDRRYYERYRQTEKDPTRKGSTEPPEEVEAFLAKADELIRDPDYRSSSNDRYRVQTDDPRLSPRAVATLLDEFRTFFDAFWDGRAELRPYDKKSRVFLFYSFHKYNQLVTGDWTLRYQRPKGHYRRGFDLITLHTDPGGAEALAESLVHEAAHQLVDQRLYPEDGQISLWVAEGLASYFGYTYRDPDGVFRTGEIGGKSLAVFRNARPSPGLEGKNRLASLRRALKSSERPEGRLFEDLVSMTDPGSFYGKGAAFNYPASWMLCHFLFHGDDGAHAAAFARYLEAEARGEGGSEVLFREIALKPQELEAAVTAHVKRVKVR